MDDIGFVNSKLKFVPPPKAEAEVEGDVWIFRLNFTDRYCEISPDGKSTHEVVGAPQWRLEGPMTVRPA